jgi:hypothetical protein
MDHDLVRAALRVLRSSADRQSPSPEDIDVLRSRVVDLDPNARPDDLACRIIQDELAKRREPKVLTATA